MKRTEYIIRASIIPALFAAMALGALWRGYEPFKIRVGFALFFLLFAVAAIVWYVRAWKTGQVKRGFFSSKEKS